MKNIGVTILRIELNPIWGLLHQLLSSGIVYCGIMILVIWQILPGAIGGLEVAHIVPSPKQVFWSLLISIARLQMIMMIIYQKEAQTSNAWTGGMIKNYLEPLTWMT